MKKYVPDKENICLRCVKGAIIGPHRPVNAPENLTWCSCCDVNLGGPNKGERRQCKAFEPRQTGGATT
jgi:hypothetical protein